MNTTLSRRSLLGSLLATGVSPLIIPSKLLGQQAPSKQITLVMIGIGRQAVNVNMPALLGNPDVRIVAVCDVDSWRMGHGKKLVDVAYKNTDCKMFADWREALAMPGIDAIVNSTSDQWHVPISLAAVNRKLHVCCEKPLTLSLREGRILADAVKKQGVVFRTDTECRSDAYMIRLAELARNGYIGKIKHFEVVVPSGDKPGGDATPTSVPEGLNYDMWVGPAPMHPYCLDRVHPTKSFKRPGWMRCSPTSEGMITNWGTHLLDVAQLANNSERIGPVSVEGTGKYPDPGSGLWDVLIAFKTQFTYANGVTLNYVMGPSPSLRIEGDEGWIQSGWMSKQNLTASDSKILKTKFKSSDLRLPTRTDKKDFINAIKTGEPVMIDAEIGHRTCSMGQIAHIAIKQGTRLGWNPATEQFAQADIANALLLRPYRSPWKLEG
jgi:predicted dehydrogenase